MALGVLDHLVVSAATLAEGVAHVEEALGVAMAGGGEHEHMGTHNRLLSMGPDDYLEVIAVNPAGKRPPYPRLFDLDNFSGSVRLTNWVMRVKNLGAALERAPTGTGISTPLSRGDFRWMMAVPASGQYPFDGAAPGMIEWLTPHPAPLLPTSGCRLVALEITHPEAQALRSALAPFLDDGRVGIVHGPAKTLRAEIETPRGVRVLG
jgi:hypothetical protein